MSKWDVSVSMRLSIDYDGIIAETKEEAIEIAKVKHWKTLIITIVIVILAIQ